MDKKPTVFPTPQQIADAEKAKKIAIYEAKKAEVTNEVYSNAIAPKDTPEGHVDAVTMMRERTANQLNQRKESGVVQEPALAEKSSVKIAEEQMRKRTEQQMLLRDEQLRKNSEQINSYQTKANEATVRNNNYSNPSTQPYMQSNNQPPTPPIYPKDNYEENYGKNPSNIDAYMVEISQPNYNAPFDVIPLPSQGKLNRSKKSNIRIGYMTTSDENILTSPNLLESGEFLEILINRKILEPELRYKDLHIGDRNAIMLWLRATGYGEMYPVTLLDEYNVPFDTEINLNELKTKNLGAEPDEEGLFDYHFPLCRAIIKFKLLTCGALDAIEKRVEADKEKGIPLNNTNTYMMESIIVSVNGDRNKSTIKDFANSIRIGDAKAFNTYIESIESGIDLNIEVGTPGGGSVKSFLPLNINFFWPNIKL